MTSKEDDDLWAKVERVVTEYAENDSPSVNSLAYYLIEASNND